MNIMDLDEDVPMGHHDTTGSSTGESVEINGHAESLDQSNAMESMTEDLYDDREEDEQMIDQAMSESPRPHLGLSLAAMPGGGINDGEDTSTSGNDSSEAIATPTESIMKPEVVIQHFADAALPYASSRTGLVYDARMRFHTELGASEDDIHPEDPRRIWEIFNELVQAGLVEDDSEPNAPFHPFRLMRIQARLAEAAEICLVHSQKHYEWVEGLERRLYFI
jgi:histone deacetylase 6